jgi:hypothetical protein
MKLKEFLEELNLFDSESQIIFSLGNYKILEIESIIGKDKSNLENKEIPTILNFSIEGDFHNDNGKSF